MLEWLHDRFFGHNFTLTPDAGTTLYECRCGKHWWVGFGLYTPTKHDHFLPPHERQAS